MNQEIYDKAIQLLNIRLHTTGELFEKLTRRNFQHDEVEEVISELERLKLLDDEEFTQVFVENMKSYKDWGYFGIKAKLIKKHVPAEIMERVLSEFYTLEDEMVVAKRTVEKLKKRGRDSYEKLARSLQSKGFRNEIIGKVLD